MTTVGAKIRCRGCGRETDALVDLPDASDEAADLRRQLAAVTAERDAALELANARANTSTPFATAYRDGVVLYFKDGKGPQNGIIPPLPRPGWEWREYIPRRLVADIESERDAASAEVARLRSVLSALNASGVATSWDAFANDGLDWETDETIDLEP